MALEFSRITAGGRSVPLCLLQFDKHGATTSPQTRAQLVEAIAARDYSDVYVFAHGWNNDFAASLELFEGFFTGFLDRRPPDTAWKPLFVGIQWPSIVIVFPWEKGPKIAGTDPDHAFQAQAVAEISQALPASQRERFEALAAQPSLTAAGRDELLALIGAALQSDQLDESGESAPQPAELLSAWRALQASDGTGDSEDFGFADDGAASPQAAGLESLDPRNLIRVATVYTMKDRAGVIGSVALRSLLEDLSAAGASVRLIGHSFGARVVLAALASASLPRPVRSALLLQPAVNQYCLAAAGQIPKSTQGGGFRRALAQLQLPLYTTFSARDFPLHETFHLSLRRSKDLGEAEIAAGAPPSIYCALGGYGPNGVAATDLATMQIQDSGTYTFAAGVQVVALDGTQGRINGHGDVSNPYTWWSLVDQDRRNVN